MKGKGRRRRRPRRRLLMAPALPSDRVAGVASKAAAAFRAVFAFTTADDDRFDLCCALCLPVTHPLYPLLLSSSTTISIGQHSASQCSAVFFASLGAAKLEVLVLDKNSSSSTCRTFSVSSVSNG